jgi:hypothetical protein
MCFSEQRPSRLGCISAFPQSAIRDIEGLRENEVPPFEL